jgi:hypothetical protein
VALQAFALPLASDLSDKVLLEWREMVLKPNPATERAAVLRRLFSVLRPQTSLSLGFRLFRWGNLDLNGGDFIGLGHVD